MFPSLNPDQTCAAQPTEGYNKKLWTGCVGPFAGATYIAQACDQAFGTKTGTAIVCNAWYPKNGKWFCQ